MRRIVIGVPCTLAMSLAATGAIAQSDTYFEHEVVVTGHETQYFTDVNEAAADIVAKECAKGLVSDCTLAPVGYFNNLFLAHYYYTDRFGDRYLGTLTGYRFYTCDIEPTLYLVESSGRVRGPYKNRYITPILYQTTAHCGLPPDPTPETEHQADLGPGDCETRPNVGNPINVGLNNKYQEVIDIAATGGSPLTWSRYYNSGVVGEADGRTGRKQTLPGTTHLGSRWRGTYDRSLAVVATKAGEIVRLQRHTGERLDFTETGGRYRSVVDPRGQLARNGTGWIYRTGAGNSETYDAEGRLVALDAGTDRHLRLVYAGSLHEVSDLQGRTLTFAYDSVGRITTVSDASGIAATYAYSELDEAGLNADLVSVTYADKSAHEYSYNEKSFVGGSVQPHALTGIRDETGLRFASFWYDATGRAVRSEHANGVDAVHLTREADGTIAVTGPTKAIHRYRFAEVRGVRKLTGVDQPGGAGCGAAQAKIEYDDDGLVSRRTNFDGRVSEYRYDAEGNETERTDAVGTPSARRTITVWHPTLRRPTSITLPGRQDRFAYDAVGNLIGREVWGAIDPTQPNAPLTLSRIWRLSYDAEGRLVHEEGPRSDTGKMGTLSRYTYRPTDATNCVAQGPCDYRKGDLWKREDALGKSEEILSYDAAGRVVSLRDAQGVVFSYTYTPRGWLTEVREIRPDGVTAATTLTHTPRGDVASITDADGITLRFEYDDAGRLIQVSNPSNHRLRFVLDAAGHRVAEEAYDTLFMKVQLKRTFDALGRIETETGAYEAVTRYTYDELGRPTSGTDADGRRDTSSYDALGRLRESIQDAGAIGASIKATYDPLDQLTSIEDPKGLITRYLATGLGDLGSTDSPDGGESTDEYDVAGLLSRHEGAQGMGSFRVIRDALGRPMNVTYGDAKLETSYTYDMADTMCPNTARYAMGRLASMAQEGHRTVYCYDAPGHVVRKIQYAGTAGAKGVSYTYSPAGRLQDVSVDGGARTSYRYDKDGSVVGVAVQPEGGATVDLITSIAYRPFDQIESWRYGNGWQLNVTHDDSGRVTSWSGIDPDNSYYSLGRTPAGKVESQTARGYRFRFDHDALGHVISVANPSTGDVLRQFEYNSTGDRTALTFEGQRITNRYGADNHHLLFSGNTARYYQSGHTIYIGDMSLAYDAAGRLASASTADRELVSYGYDAADQRIARTETATRKTALTLYDEDGRWLADYDAYAKVVRQAVWVGDYLMGVVDAGQVLYVEPDHLGTPRAVIDPVRGKTVWRWRPSDDPFGTSQPDEDPDADGKRFVFDLRFPGQRYDSLTGLHYNYYRDYDPSTGRYIQIDPMGLAGGINPYLYGNGAPLMYTDPTGEVPLPLVTAAIGLLGAAVGDTAAQLYGMYKSDWCKDFNWRELGISAAGGGLTGLGLPAVSAIGGAAGVAAVGGVANVGVYVANGGDVSDGKGLVWAVGTGIAGGAVGGKVARIVSWSSKGTAASSNMIGLSNNAANVRLNTGSTSVLRGLAGGSASSAPVPSSALPPCGCGH